jgi:hypothetical protein
MHVDRILYFSIFSIIWFTGKGLKVCHMSHLSYLCTQVSMYLLSALYVYCIELSTLQYFGWTVLLYLLQDILALPRSY